MKGDKLILITLKKRDILIALIVALAFVITATISTSIMVYDPMDVDNEIGIRKPDIVHILGQPNSIQKRRVGEEWVYKKANIVVRFDDNEVVTLYRCVRPKINRVVSRR